MKNCACVGEDTILKLYQVLAVIATPLSIVVLELPSRVIH
jgi:hypothetical protein